MATRTRAPVSRLTQPWWRFSRYELRDDFLRPAPGATLQSYVPWDLHQESRQSEKRGHQSPYQELAALLDEFHGALNYSAEFVPTPQAVDTLLDWCRRYGLLGLLLQQSEMVFFPPMSVWACGDPDPAAESEPTWVLTHYTREPGAWHVHTEFCSPSYAKWNDHAFDDPDPTCLPTFRPSKKTPACPVPEDWPKPHVLTRDLQNLWWQPHQPLAEGWFSSFPGISDQTQPTPLPLTPEFWSAYAEPLDSFLSAAVMLRSAMEWYVNKPEGGVRLRGPAPDVPTRRKFPALEYHIYPPDAFKRMLLGVAPTVETTKKGKNWTHRQVLLAPSLLGMFAAMFLTDLTEGREVRTCVVCSKVFVSGAHAAKYCSVTCRSRITKRRLRENMAKARRLHSQGRSPTVIAKKLGSDVKTVRGWIKKAPGKKTPRRTRSKK